MSVSFPIPPKSVSALLLPVNKSSPLPPLSVTADNEESVMPLRERVSFAVVPFTCKVPAPLKLKWLKSSVLALLTTKVPLSTRLIVSPLMALASKFKDFPLVMLMVLTPEISLLSVVLALILMVSMVAIFEASCVIAALIFKISFEPLPTNVAFEEMILNVSAPLPPMSVSLPLPELIISALLIADALTLIADMFELALIVAIPIALALTPSVREPE